jgi:hypothetical protein
LLGIVPLAKLRANVHLPRISAFCQGFCPWQNATFLVVVGLGITSQHNNITLSFLAKWREASGLTKLVKSVLSGFRQDGMGNRGEYFNVKEKTMSPNIRKFLRKVAGGYFTTAVKVLGSSGVAPYN